MQIAQQQVLGGQQAILRRGGFGGADDGRVAGAAAQVAGELRVVIRGPVQMVGGHGDGKARRAKAALAAVVVDHGLLHGVQAAVRRR